MNRMRAAVLLAVVSIACRSEVGNLRERAEVLRQEIIDRARASEPEVCRGVELPEFPLGPAVLIGAQEVEANVGAMVLRELESLSGSPPAERVKLLHEALRPIRHKTMSLGQPPREWVPDPSFLDFRAAVEKLVTSIDHGQNVPITVVVDSDVYVSSLYLTVQGMAVREPHVAIRVDGRWHGLVQDGGNHDPVLERIRFRGPHDPPPTKPPPGSCARLVVSVGESSTAIGWSSRDPDGVVQGLMGPGAFENKPMAKTIPAFEQQVRAISENWQVCDTIDVDVAQSAKWGSAVEALCLAMAMRGNISAFKKVWFLGKTL